MEFSLLGAAAVAGLSMWLATRLDHRLSGIPDPFGVLLSATLVGLVVGRLVAMLGTGTNPISFDFVLIRGGVSTVGASLAAVAWLGWSTRRTIGWADLLAPAALFGLAGWHAGCLVRNSCLGAATSLPWGWALPGSPVERHPVELYAALLLLLGAWAVRRLAHRTTTEAVTGRAGRVAAAAVVVAAAARLATEPLRLTLGGLTWFYGFALVAGFAAFFVLGWRTPSDQHR